MRIIEQLNKLPVNKGEYLVLPDIDTPFFIIPMQSRIIFKKAVRFIKPKNKHGWIKKILLSIIPFSLIRSFFYTIKISTNFNEQYPQLILPWNQDFDNKFVIFNLKSKPTLIKVGFKDAKSLIKNENKTISHILVKNNQIAPVVLNYEETKSYSLIETNFYHGKHPELLPDAIRNFFLSIYKESQSITFSHHPYIRRMISSVYKKLDKTKYKDILNQIDSYIEEFANINIPICIMHGDCTRTNIIVNNEETIIIDWEECILDGVPIDVEYFAFRNNLDKTQAWKIKDEIDFLVVLHYIHFQCLYSNHTRLEKISWIQDTVSLKR